uniref:Uncharacterized protein n=1 Tax=Kalanchoe fedtschenkoi TaxID=63787 RepID=A0A7N0RBM0_KALFE
MDNGTHFSPHPIVSLTELSQVTTTTGLGGWWPLLRRSSTNRMSPLSIQATPSRLPLPPLDSDSYLHWICLHRRQICLLHTDAIASLSIPVTYDEISSDLCSIGVAIGSNETNGVIGHRNCCSTILVL